MEWQLTQKKKGFYKSTFNTQTTLKRVDSVGSVVPKTKLFLVK